MNLIHASGGLEQSAQSESALYTVTVRSMAGEIKETLDVSEAKLDDLKTNLTTRYNEDNTDPSKYIFLDPKLTGDKAEVSYVKKFRPYRVTKTKDTIEIFLVNQLFNDGVSIRMPNINEETGSDTYYSRLDEFDFLLNPGNWINNPNVVYINHQEIGHLFRFGELYKLSETILLAQEIGVRIGREVADILSTLVWLDSGHAFLRCMANNFSICRYSKTEYAVNYMKYKHLLLEINFTD